MTIFKSRSRCQTPVRNIKPPPKSQIRTLRTYMSFAPSKSRQRAKIRNIGVAKTSDHIKIKIKIPNPSQEPPAPTKAPYQDIKDMDVLCTFKIKIEIQNLEHGPINPNPAGGGLIGPPFWKTRFTQNFTWVSDYIIDLLFKWMPYVHFDIFFLSYPIWGPC